MVKKNKQLGVGGLHIGSKEKKYVMDVLNQSRLSYGPYTKKFESLFGQIHGCDYSIFVNSGTSALRLAVAALKEIHHWDNNSEIICPAVTFVASSNVIIMNGLKPVFVDVDSQIYNIDPQKIEQAITKNTKAIMVVHLFGQAADMDPIMILAKKYKLKVIEDSCETMFVKYKGNPVGSFGDVSCFSTYVAHLLVTGVGGLACTNNKKYALKIKSLANHGRDGIYLSIDDDKNLDQKKLQQVVSRRFKFVSLGYSFRATEMEAALGLAQLEKKDDNLNKRQKNAKYLISKLSIWDKYIQLPSYPKESEHAFMMFPVVIKKGSGVKKKELVMYLEKNNIETRDMLPLINQPIYKKLFGDLESKYPVAKWINNNGFYIGCHPGLTKSDLDYIIDKFNHFFLNIEK